MSNSAMSSSAIGTERRPLQIGFIPDIDCAPVIWAHESGLFQKYELRVELHRETRWSSLRDKIIHGELDAAHAPATLPFVTNLGLDSDQCACVTGLVLSLQGNAITVSRELWNKGVRDAARLRELVYQNWGRRTYTFGVVLPHSPSFFLLRQWLTQAGILPGIEVRMVVVPPAQLFPTLNLGYLDGFCGGEPWTSLVSDAGAGNSLTTSAQVAPMHPEKVLMVRREFAEDRASEHERLIAALLESCAFCDQASNHAVLSRVLGHRQYVNAPTVCIQRGFAGTGDFPNAADSGHSGRTLFHCLQANDPTDAKALWLVEHLSELLDESILQASAMKRAPVIKNVFRRDVYERAKALAYSQTEAAMKEAEAYSAGVKIA